MLAPRLASSVVHEFREAPLPVRLVLILAMLLLLPLLLAARVQAVSLLCWWTGKVRENVPTPHGNRDFLL